MSGSTKQQIRAAALNLFDRQGVTGTTIAQIRAAAGVSNGSFFHAYKSRDSLCSDLYLRALKDYHSALCADLPPNPDEGIAALIQAHLEWVVTSGPSARFLFEHARTEWLQEIRADQTVENERFSQEVSAWRTPLLKAALLTPMSDVMFFAQLIGPAQVFCRGWLSGRTDQDPREHAPVLIENAQKVLLVGKI